MRIATVHLLRGNTYQEQEVPYPYPEQKNKALSCTQCYTPTSLTDHMRRFRSNYAISFRKAVYHVATTVSYLHHFTLIKYKREILNTAWFPFEWYRGILTELAILMANIVRSGLGIFLLGVIFHLGTQQRKLKRRLTLEPLM